MPRRLPTRRRLAGWLAVAGLTGCSGLKPNPVPAVPGGARAQAAAVAPKKPGGVHPPVRVGRFVFYADTPLEPADAVFRELERLPEQVHDELRLPEGTAVIQVFLFPDQETYEAFMRDRYPWLPVRRAYFIADQKRPGSADDLQVFTYLGDHLRTDLRHELTHALLHGVLTGVPLWLDEGLAGYFERPPADAGVNPDHLDRLRGQPTDLGRLEKITQVKQMEKPEYREAWGWTHLLLRGDPRGKAALMAYLQELRETPTPAPLAPRLAAVWPDANAALADHLGRLTGR
jgi:hypothetical protein